MKKLIIAAAILTSLFVFTNAQQPAAKQQLRPTPLTYTAFREYVNDYDKSRIGKQIVVSDVPLSADSQKHEITGLFALRAGGEDAIDVFTSPALARRLRTHGQTTARISCTIIEFRGKFDISMWGFITKVEGMSADGSVLWVETGTPPTRLRYRV